MTLPRTVVLDDYQQAAAGSKIFRALDGSVEIEFWREHVADPNLLIERLRGAEIVVAMRERTAFPESVLEQLPDLKLLITTGPFNAVIDVVAAERHGIVVCGTGGLREPTSELTWGLILALCRHIPAEDAAIRAGRWQTTVGRDLKGKRLGLLGLGHIGSAVARVGLAFGMDVAAWSENLDPAHALSLGVNPLDREKLLRTSDILSIHLVLSERTHHLIGAAELELMKPSVLLINTSRGGLIDQEALCDALAEGQISGAALDVYEDEPLPVESRLRALRNTVLTPHAGYVTEGAYDVFFGDAADNIRAYLEGTPRRVIQP